MSAGVRLAGALSVVALLAMASGPARAVIESATVDLPSCENGAGTNCTDTAYLNSTLAGASSSFIGSPVLSGSLATFTTAFDAWDLANGDKWTLVNGGTLSLTLSAYIGLTASNAGAGLSPVLFTVSGASASLLPSLVWVQALVVDYSPLTTGLIPTEQTLDTFSLSQNGSNPNFPTSCSTWANGAGAVGATFCGPIYPFQYGSSLSQDTLDGIMLGSDFFYDAPEGPWDASFEAITLLAEVNTTSDELTVFQGFEYGFYLDATPTPEASTWVMMAIGFAGVAFVGHRARRASTTIG